MNRDHSLEKAMASASGSTTIVTAAGKAKTVEDKPDSAGMDELFAVLGYKLKSSDMADVAEKLEQLEMALATTTEQDGASVLSTDTVHYNPSDLSGWVDTMLSDITTSCGCGFEIGNIPGESSSGNHNTTGSSRTDGERRRVTYDDDLSAIPGGAVLQSGANKRMRISAGFLENVSPPVTAARPFVVDSQETGVRLVHALTACGEAVQQGNMKLADALVQHVSVLAVSQGGAMGKVATYFAAALAQIIYRIGFSQLDPLQSDLLQMHFYETTPYLKFAHFTANQAILEAFAGSDRVHVVDFSLKEGMQWPALMQALALRPGGPPAFRLTGIGPTGPEYLEALQEVGWKLGQLAESMGVEFKFCGLGVNSLANLTGNMLGIGPDSSETVAVNSVLELHPLLARPGAIEKVLGSIKAMDPKIVTVVEQEVNHNGDVFRERFNEALHYFSTMFDSLESSGSTQPYDRDLTMTDVYLGRQICNVVASDGQERVERHETLGQWRARFVSAGFDPVHLGSSAFKQASMLLSLFACGDGYRVEENDGCLMLGWHTRPLFTTSAWQIGAGV